jgi:hypothetical protein
MDNQQIPNSPTKPTRRHTIEVNSQSMMPRFDFVLPSYRRDRRLSSITSIVPPETILEHVSTNVSLESVAQNPSPQEVANNEIG